MSSDYEIKLVGAATPDGEIRLSDLAAIAESWQELSLRVGRAYVDAEGPGRTKRTIEELTQFRLRGLAPGSTRLLLTRGPDEELDLELEQATRLERRFWEVIEAVGADRRPDWVSDLVADSAAQLVSALQSAAPEIVVCHSAWGLLHVRTSEIHQETWTSERRVRGDQEVTVTGRLEKVDLRSHDFRIRDDAGNTIELNRVRDDEAVASYVGSYVTAQGQAVLNREGRLVAIAEPTLQRDDSPLSVSRVPKSIPLEVILGVSPGPDPGGAVELSEDEFAAFLEAIGS